MSKDFYNTRYGQMFLIKNDRIISEAVRNYGEWAQHEVNFFAGLITPGDHIYDVGANIGTHTLAFASLTGPTGLVTAFEPRPEFFSILEKNTGINQLHNVHLEPCALGEVAGSMNVDIIDLSSFENFGGLAINSNHSPTSNQIQIKTIDQIAPRRLDILKIDAEGMESAIIRGAVDTILRIQPIIIAECNSIDGALPVLEFAYKNKFLAWGICSPAYNPNNFYQNNTHNMFGDSVELSLLIIPQSRMHVMSEPVLAKTTGRIKNADELALFLLQKPQYPYEVLGQTDLGKEIGTNYPSPFANNKAEALSQSNIRHEEINRKCDELKDRKDKIQREYSTLIELYNRKSEELKAREDEIQRMQNSISWRMTAPFRGIRRILERFRH